MRPQSDLHDLLPAIRQRLDFSQKDMAARLGVTVSSIRRWESGAAAPSPSAIRQIQQILIQKGDAWIDLLMRYFPELKKDSHE